jgi:uncharacterized protein YprB with RNaseH-like and TPR domain
MPGTDGEARGLPGLEGALLGEVCAGLPLKERLERLVAAVGRGGPERRRFREAFPLESLVSGTRVRNDQGEFLLVEEDLHLESFEGGISLTRFRTLPSRSVSILTGEPELDGFDFRDTAFLDTETTGLSGGAGTAAFLVGIGFLDGDRFRVRQYLMQDYDQEAALLHGLSEDLRSFSHLVTYNGRQFDVPLLETRYRLNRCRFPLSDARHLDLLPPARRLWKERFESCRLQFLETQLLGVRRSHDVPGEEIPRIYFDFVRSRDGRGLARVLDHNRHDLVSLAALTVLACEWVQEERASDPRDLYSLGRVFERACLEEQAEAQYLRVLDCDETPVRVRTLMRLAEGAKRRGEHARAVALWEEAARAGEPWALRQLAVHHEHRGGDLGAALEAAERGLLLANNGARGLGRDLESRRRRLRRRLAGRPRRSAGCS